MFSMSCVCIGVVRLVQGNMITEAVITRSTLSECDDPQGGSRE